MIAAVPRTKPRAVEVIQRPCSARRLSEIEFCAWIGAAAAGEMIEYHRGSLAVDIVPVISKLPEPERTGLKKLAARAWWTAERGLVHLVQRRNGPDDYSYLAIARPRAKGALPDFASHTITEEAA